MRAWTLSEVVVVGESMVRGRSGMGGEKRMTRRRGDVILGLGGGGGGLRRRQLYIYLCWNFLENRLTSF